MLCGILLLAFYLICVLADISHEEVHKNFFFSWPLLQIPSLLLQGISNSFCEFLADGFAGCYFRFEMSQFPHPCHFVHACEYVGKFPVLNLLSCWIHALSYRQHARSRECIHYPVRCHCKSVISDGPCRLWPSRTPSFRLCSMLCGA